MALDLGTLLGKIGLDDSQFEGVVTKLPGKLEAAGPMLAIAGAAIAAAAGVAFVGGMERSLDLQDARANIEAELGLSATDSERIGGIAGKLYASAYGDSIEGVNDAVVDVVSSIDGMRTASNSSVEDMTAKVLNFNTVFGVDTARTTQLVGQMLKTGLVSDANEGMDLLTAAMQRVPTAVREDVLDAMDEYGPFFAQLGMSGEEAMGALVKGSEQGMYGIDKTGDALKELTIRATDMSASSVAAYEAAGLNATDMSAKFLAGGEQGAQGMQQLVDGLLGITDPVAQANAAIGLFGTPLEDLGTDKIPTFLQSLSEAGGGMDDAAGAADRMGAAVNGTARVGWTEVQRQFGEVATTVTTMLLPAVSAVVDWLASNPGTVQAFAAILGVLAVAFVAVSVATWLMNAAFLANPVTWIVLGIVALIAALALLIGNWDTVVAWISGVWGGFVGWLTDSLNGLASWWGGVWDGFLGFLSDAWTNIVSFVSGALQGLLDLFLTYHPLGIIIDNWGAIVDWFAGLPQSILDGITTGWNAVVEWFTGLPAAIGGFLVDAGTWLLTTGYDLLVGLLAGILVGAYLLGEWFTNLPTAIGEFVLTANTWLLTKGTELITGLRDGIVTGWTTVSDWFTNLPAAIAAFVVSANVWLLTKGAELLTGLRNGIVAGWVAVSAWFTALPGNIAAFVVGMATWLIIHGTNLLRGLQSGITTGWATVSAWFAALPGRVTGFLSGAASWLLTQGQNVMQGLSSGISNGWSTVTTFLASIPGKITGALSGAATWLSDIGRNIIDGLVSGIKGAVGRVTSAVGDIASDVKNKFANILGIHSPSLVFRGFGLNIGEGLIQGLAAIQPEITGAVQGLVAVPEVPGMSVDADGNLYGSAGGGYSGPLVDARTIVHGNVGWSEAEVAARNREQMERGLALAGLDEIVGVA